MKGFENAQDESNWQALKDGKPEALSAIFHQYYDSLFRYGQKLTNNNTELTKEIIQDMFFKIWERRSSLGDIRDIKVYLFVAFRRILIDKSRHVMVEEAHAASLNVQNFFENSAEDAFLLEEERLTDAKKLKKAILKLPNRVREAITLRYFEEMATATLPK